MTWEVVVGAVLSTLTALFGGLWLSRRHGARVAERDQARRERDDAFDLAERRARALETDEQQRSRALAELDRRRRMRGTEGRS